MRYLELCTLTESQIDDLLGLMKELNGFNKILCYPVEMLEIMNLLQAAYDETLKDDDELIEEIGICITNKIFLLLKIKSVGFNSLT